MVYLTFPKSPFLVGSGTCGIIVHQQNVYRLFLLISTYTYAKKQFIFTYV